MCTRARSAAGVEEGPTISWTRLIHRSASARQSTHSAPMWQCGTPSITPAHSAAARARHRHIVSSDGASSPAASSSPSSASSTPQPSPSSPLLLPAVSPGCCSLVPPAGRAPALTAASARDGTGSGWADELPPKSKSPQLRQLFCRCVVAFVPTGHSPSPRRGLSPQHPPGTPLPVRGRLSLSATVRAAASGGGAGRGKMRARAVSPRVPSRSAILVGEAGWL